MILGITGGSGSGKTTLLEMIRQRGGTVLDCDAIYHRLLREDPALLGAIEARFPHTVEHGVLRREKLGNIVFADDKALADLNRITHGAVRAEVLRLLADRPGLAAIDAIALFESGLAELCDVTVAVSAPEALRVRRLMQRDGISREYAEKRIAAQKKQADFSSMCDYSLENDGDKQAFATKCLAFFQQLGIIEQEI